MDNGKDIENIMSLRNTAFTRGNLRWKEDLIPFRGRKGF